METYKKVDNYFDEMRNDKNHHLGMGDIRLTMGQQDEIVEWIKSGAGVSSACNTVLTGGEASSAEGPQIIECQLVSLDFEENWISFQLTEEQMKEGFHAGTAKIDISGIR